MNTWAKASLVTAMLGMMSGLVAGRPVAAQTTAAPSGAAVPVPVPVIGVEDDWPPFAWIEKPGQAPRGYSVEVVRQAFGEMGVAVQLAPMPFARCMHEARTGRLAGCFNSIFNDETRSDYLLPAAPLVHEPLVVLTRASAPRENIDAKALEGRTVGFIQSYHYPDWFTNNKAIVRVPASSDVALLRMLERGRIDFVMYGATAAAWRLQIAPELSDVKVRVAAQLSNDGFGIAFSKSHPQGEALRRDFELGLSRLQAGDRLKELQRRHLPAPLQTQ